ncbi:hypothetical protein PR202_gb24561 [Eleusine coracana subsp. coracana]|uniref:Uncharacterized protein n=1 Tax=Eleusine coracana subsp. coracana TaxID=191504 RepID=A0AAV5FMC1_ELECO|nr:hypothetical protein PR202_gb24561 [Eleusine coracana subsp. coracana]
MQTALTRRSSTSPPTATPTTSDVDGPLDPPPPLGECDLVGGEWPDGDRPPDEDGVGGERPPDEGGDGVSDGGDGVSAGGDGVAGVPGEEEEDGDGAEGVVDGAGAAGAGGDGADGVVDGGGAAGAGGEGAEGVEGGGAAGVAGGGEVALAGGAEGVVGAGAAVGDDIAPGPLRSWGAGVPLCSARGAAVAADLV